MEGTVGRECVGHAECQDFVGGFLPSFGGIAIQRRTLFFFFGGLYNRYLFTYITIPSAG